VRRTRIKSDGAQALSPTQRTAKPKRRTPCKCADKRTALRWTRTPANNPQILNSKSERVALFQDPHCIRACGCRENLRIRIARPVANDLWERGPYFHEKHELLTNQALSGKVRQAVKRGLGTVRAGGRPLPAGPAVGVKFHAFTASASAPCAGLPGRLGAVGNAHDDRQLRLPQNVGR